MRLIPVFLAAVAVTWPQGWLHWPWHKATDHGISTLLWNASAPGQFSSRCFKAISSSSSKTTSLFMKLAMYLSYFRNPKWALVCHCFSIHSAVYFTGKAIQNSQGYGFRVKMTVAVVSFGVTWTPGAWWCPHTCLGRAWVHEDFLHFERVLAPLAGGGAGAELGQQQADILVLNSLCCPNLASLARGFQCQGCSWHAENPAPLSWRKPAGQRGSMCWAEGFYCLFSSTKCNLLCCHSLSSFRFFWGYQKPKPQIFSYCKGIIFDKR